ncbi:J domain-containing protein [Chelatococcus reniformis]|uniref:J domain-containing protein n=1 Tax=Chelatococcus reniformis TaxID=1494448 RepID=A0A916UBT1_9HYPH|nr:DnaJ family molecular chaperone [Chelatococcus reniformis]GGC67128.1 hypothetical protein GCM10010994_27110 [Chelatococcus reniformis]
MSVWGKLSGAGLGALIGGPLGALVGGAAGHALVDRLLFGTAPPDVVFATGLVALCAKMAKADGVVTQNEVLAFRRIIDVPPAELRRVERLFDLARHTTAGYEAYARQLRDRFRDDQPLLESVVDGLFEIAKADHAIHEAETAYLEHVTLALGLDHADYRRIEARHVARPDDPYVVLGAERGMSNAELRTHYRRLVSESHPDRLIAAGLPAEAVSIATDRTAAINAAWERIRRERAA